MSEQINEQNNFETATVAHEETSAGHETTLYAEPVSQVGGFSITNSMLITWLVVIVVVIFSLVLRKKLKTVPRGLQNVFELIVEGALNLADTVTGDRKKTLKFFPIVFTFFIFILLNNWFGLLPGVGSIGFFELHEGQQTFIPLLRGGTADLNTTLFLALFAVVASHVVGVIIVGAWKHLNKFINFQAFIDIPKKIRRDPTIVLVNPIKAFVGIVEVIGEIAKVASLSFRLFGNIFAGEVLLVSMAAIFAFILPVPFMFLEVVVGVIQALIFAVLALVYMTIASTAEEH